MGRDRSISETSKTATVNLLILKGRFVRQIPVVPRRDRPTPVSHGTELRAAKRPFT